MKAMLIYFVGIVSRLGIMRIFSVSDRKDYVNFEVGMSIEFKEILMQIYRILKNMSDGAERLTFIDQRDNIKELKQMIDKFNKGVE